MDDEAAGSDTSYADTSVADTSYADTSVADTSYADTSVADYSAGDTSLTDPSSSMGYNETAAGQSGNQAFDDYISGNDPNSYDNLPPQQGFLDYVSDNEGYGWDNNSGNGTIWASGDPTTDQQNFGY